MFDFEGFLSKRIGLGKAQYLAVFSICMIEMEDGLQSISVALITPILQQQFELSSSEVSLITSVFFIGTILGIIASGVMANKIGRKKAIVIGIVLQIISGTLMIFVNEKYEFFAVRLLYGVGFGATINIAPIIASQIIPLQQRGRGILIINFCSVFGKIAGILLAFIFIPNPGEGHWRTLVLFSTIPAFVGLLLILMFLKQSFRFYLYRKEYGEAFMTINLYLQENSIQNQLLTSEQKQGIQEWSRQAFRKNQSQSPMVIVCLIKRKVVCLSLAWFSVCFIFFGEMFILPFMLEHNGDHNLVKFLWMNLGEMPSLLITWILIQNYFFGRKKSLLLFNGLCIVFCILVSFFLNSVLLFFTKLWMKSIFQMLYPFTAESYTTPIRSLGYSLNSGFGRLGAIVMPFIVYPFYLKFPKSPFLMFAVVTAIGFAAIAFTEKDTFKKPLDEDDEDGQPKQRIENELVEVQE